MLRVILHHWNTAKDTCSRDSFVDPTSSYFMSKRVKGLLEPSLRNDMCCGLVQRPDYSSAISSHSKSVSQWHPKKNQGQGEEEGWQNN